MMSKAHSSHQGIEASLRKARDSIYWPAVNSEIKDYVQQCSICNEFQSKQTKEPLMIHPIPKLPWSKIGTDLFSIRDKDYLITVDYYSDFWELNELSSTSADTIIKCLKEHFSRHGIPNTVISDNGPQFTNDAFRNFADEWDFEHATSSPYHSQSNGKAESAVKIAKGIIKKSMKEKEDLWRAILDWRNTPTQDMGCSPAQRLMSRRTRSSLPIAHQLLKPEIQKNVQTKIRIKRQRSKQYYDKGTRPLAELCTGDYLRVKPTRLGDDKWKFGKCVKKHTLPRSYIVDIDGVQYRRNRRDLRLSREVPPPEDLHVDDHQDINSHDKTNGPTVKDNEKPQEKHQFSQPNVRRSLRTIVPPKHLADYVCK
ncbi:uncharacterized protein K02A2.6-like [Saccostrea cucullata]|uniref:uncharacterized protein K02A2.6-like n=1 Tax=Saccostrea cuccullata TaxID=36930 RepID=UPI002ED001DB